MAGVSKRNEFHDDEPDWTAANRRPTKSGGFSGLAIGGIVVLLILVGGGLALWQRQETEDRRRAQAELEHMMMDQRAFAEHHETEQRQMRQEGQTRAARERAAVDDVLNNHVMPPFRPPDLPSSSPAVAFHKKAILCELAGDLDGAVNALREAARLDPAYQEEFERVLKLQTIRNREQTAPPPRVVNQP